MCKGVKNKESAQQKTSWDDLYMEYKTNPQNSIIDWDSESLSAILFHSIYTTLKPINNKSKDHPHTILDNLFTNLLYYEFSDTFIKAVLRYTQANLRANNRARFTPAQQVMFSELIAQVVVIFNSIRRGLIDKTFTPERFRSCDLQPFKSVYYYHDIPKNGDYTFSNVLETIKMVTSHGFYVLLILHHHVVLITGTNENNLLIKNSWGPMARTWKAGDINLTEYGILKWETLVQYLNDPPPRDPTWSPILVELIFIVPFRFKSLKTLKGVDAGKKNKKIRLKIRLKIRSKIRSKRIQKKQTMSTRFSKKRQITSRKKSIRLKRKQTGKK